MRLALGLALLIALGVLPGPAIAATPPQPEESIGIQLLEMPVSRQEDPRAKMYIVDHLAPGTTIRRKIQVSSTMAQPADVSVYDAAAIIDGDTFTGAPGREENELNDWTRLDRTRLVLEPGGTEQLTVTIAVPEEAAEGERYGVVWAETRSEGGAGAVTAVNRVGIRMYLSIGPGGEPASDMQIESLTAGRREDSLPVVTSVVKNTGGRALDLKGELNLSEGPGGLSAGPFRTDAPTTLLPGQTGKVQFVLDPRLPAGPWHARVQVASGSLTKAAEASLTFPATVEASVPVPAEIPWLTWLAGTVLLLLLLALLLLLLRRRRTAPRQEGVRS